jgi:hypothetical protein
LVREWRRPPADTLRICFRMVNLRQPANGSSEIGEHPPVEMCKRGGESPRGDPSRFTLHDMGFRMWPCMYVYIFRFQHPPTTQGFSSTSPSAFLIPMDFRPGERHQVLPAVCSSSLQWPIARCRASFRPHFIFTSPDMYEHQYQY